MIIGSFRPNLDSGLEIKRRSLVLHPKPRPHPQKRSRAMGALVVPMKWSPEDDLLLKNAVEAGASLESLAKGAVCFSRRFTLRELQDRWYSLLYDSSTSTEASAHMIEFEVEVSMSNPAKGNRNCNLKGKCTTSGKRKGESIRSHYYARQKLFRSEPCISENPGFVVSPYSHFDTDTVYNCGDRLILHDQLQADNSCPGERALHCYGYTEQDAFPEMLRFNSAETCGNNSHPAFDTEYVGSIEDDCPNEIADRGYLYDFKGRISPELVDKARLNNADQSFENDYIQKDPQFLGENLASPDASENIHERNTNKPFPMSELSVNKVEVVNALSIVASENENSDDVQENNKTSLHAPGFGDSSHQLGCSSTITCMPLSGMATDISSQTILMNIQVEGEEVVPIVDSIINKPVVNNASSEDNAGNKISDVGLNNPEIISENDLMDFSSAFMEFPDDEDLMFIDIDDKDNGDTPCLNDMSSMLGSPGNTHEVEANLSNMKETKNSDCIINILDESHSEETNKNHDQDGSLCANDPVECVTRENLPTSCSTVSHTVVSLEGLLICSLNTEHPEIPCNDNILLPSQSLPRFSASTNLLSTDSKCHLDLTKVKEEQVPISQPAVSLFSSMSSSLPKAGVMKSTDDIRLAPKSFERGFKSTVPRDGNLAPNDKRTCKSVVSHSVADTLMKEEIEFDKSVNRHLDIPASGFDHSKLHTPCISDGCKTELDVQGTVEQGVPLNSELVLSNMGLSRPVLAISTSDQELQLSDSEDDVANFSDVEALILDMDLGPYDQESYLFAKEVSLYQPAHSKKAIMRLEQGAHAYMNRKILSNGAFAVFYGRVLKYFIKKTEVLLGRGTDDVDVDIDLRQEGQANKISRRQAIIRMDKDGVFLLKNTGKCSIFVNSKEVATSKRIILSSGSLIEIRDMRFIIEVNQNEVRRRIASASKRPNTELRW